MLTGFQIVVNGFFKGAAQRIYTFTVEAYNIAYTGYMADKAFVIVAVFNAGSITFVLHGFHGFTPMASKKARASRI